MSLDIASFLIGIAGLALGIVATYTQLRNFVLRMFRLSSASAQRFYAKHAAKLEALTEHPSALVAYIANGLLTTVAIFGATYVVVQYLQGTLWISPPRIRWVEMTGALLGGLRLGTLHGTIMLVSKYALQSALDKRQIG